MKLAVVIFLAMTTWAYSQSATMAVRAKKPLVNGNVIVGDVNAPDGYVRDSGVPVLPLNVITQNWFWLSNGFVNVSNSWYGSAAHGISVGDTNAWTHTYKTTNTLATLNGLGTVSNSWFGSASFGVGVSDTNLWTLTYLTTNTLATLNELMTVSNLLTSSLGGTNTLATLNELMTVSNLLTSSLGGTNLLATLNELGTVSNSWWGSASYLVGIGDTQAWWQASKDSIFATNWIATNVAPPTSDTLADVAARGDFAGTETITPLGVNARYFGNLAGQGISGSLNTCIGDEAGYGATGFECFYGGLWSGDASSVNYGMFLGMYSGEHATGAYQTGLGWSSLYGAHGTNLIALGNWAGRNGGGSNQIYIDSYKYDPGSSYDPSSSAIYVDNGNVYLGRSGQVGKSNYNVTIRGNIYSDLGYFGSNVIYLGSYAISTTNSQTWDMSKAAASFATNWIATNVPVVSVTETDPVFEAWLTTNSWATSLWNKAAVDATSATGNVVLLIGHTNDYYPRSNPSNFISGYTETDPVFTAWLGTNTWPQTNLDLSWLYPRSNPSNYIFGYTETDPVFNAWVLTNAWEPDAITAYSWGNHATNNYAKTNQDDYWEDTNGLFGLRGIVGGSGNTFSILSTNDQFGGKYGTKYPGIEFYNSGSTHEGHLLAGGLPVFYWNDSAATMNEALDMNAYLMYSGDIVVGDFGNFYFTNMTWNGDIIGMDYLPPSLALTNTLATLNELNTVSNQVSSIAANTGSFSTVSQLTTVSNQVSAINTITNTFVTQLQLVGSNYATQVYVTNQTAIATNGLRSYVDAQDAIDLTNATAIAHTDAVAQAAAATNLSKLAGAGVTTNNQPLAWTQVATTGSVSSTFTFNGSGSPGTSSNVVIRYSVAGSFVTLFIPQVTATAGTQSNILSSNTPLPSSLRPISAYQYSWSLLLTAGINSPGLIGISTNGIISIYQNEIGSYWSNGATSQGFFPCVFTYWIGPGS